VAQTLSEIDEASQHDLSSGTAVDMFVKKCSLQLLDFEPTLLLS